MSIFERTIAGLFGTQGQPRRDANPELQAVLTGDVAAMARLARQANETPASPR